MGQKDLTRPGRGCTDRGAEKGQALRAGAAGSAVIAYAEMASWAAMLLLYVPRFLMRLRKERAGRQ